MSGLLLYCRPGFEKDLANEIQDKAGALEAFGYPQLKVNDGYIVYQCYEPDQADLLAKKLPLTSLVFARQMFACLEQVTEMDPGDRIGPILAAVKDFPLCGELRVEHPDTEKGKELSKLCRKFTVPLRQALRKQGKLLEKEVTNRPTMHVFFTDSLAAYVGYSYSYNQSPLPGGILRLKFPSASPSRSTLKLEEAFQLFVPKDEHEKRLTSGMNAVDLGACPGGWTYQLVRRGMFVTAIDNGAMADSLMDTGQVKHYAEDGFKFRPKKKNVHWLVCDMIEQPQKVAKLMATWVAEGECQEAMFNLKLPMKRRYDSVKESLALIEEVMAKHGYSRYELQVKHLYHDREEVTAHLRLTPRN